MEYMKKYVLSRNERLVANHTSLQCLFCASFGPGTTHEACSRVSGGRMAPQVRNFRWFTSRDEAPPVLNQIARRIARRNKNIASCGAPDLCSARDLVQARLRTKISAGVVGGGWRPRPYLRVFGHYGDLGGRKVKPSPQHFCTL
jgi:hypothetical protein